MNDASFLRAPTIMQAFHDAGAKVAVVTAKDKLRAMLGKDLDMSTGRAIAFSSEKADKATVQANGIGDVLDAHRQAAAGGLFVRSLRIRDGGRRLDPEEGAARPDVSLDHRLRAAQGRAGLGVRECVLRHDGPLRRRARRGGRRAGAHRRPRHERQASAERRAGRDLPAEPPRRVARQGRRARDPADHRPLRGASRRARLVRHDLPARRRRRERAARPAARGRGRRGGDLARRRPASASSCRPTASATSW